MVSQSIKLGGTAADISVGRVAVAIKAGVDALPAGTKMFLNSGEFYDSKWGTGNLQLLSRFYNKYPEYADKTFLSVKGAMSFAGGKIAPDCSMEGLRRSVDNIQKELGPIKKLDLFQPARIDRNVPVETLMNNLVALLKEGNFSHIGLSECNANTLRKAHSIYPITAAEIEVSPWAYEKEQKAVISTATELNISVVAYSPLGQGFLTGSIKSLADLPEGDHRAGYERFKEENIKANLAIVDSLKAIAEKKGITPAQLAIAWVASLGPTMIPLPGSSKASRTLENLQGGDVELTAEELKGIADVLAAHPVAGERYYGAAADLYLWG
ncbi:aldo/keto reductase [Gymnopus androsaceus JB14]|uniref:Aldo/keto reductase n=1 Tax=Gymnopus androsaceus JB14 TaxID=1447944 RepID=A0A6A4HHN4_9AGAR|nr:aldo/keto reductase [Gymnopus androsaceus JB14]